MVVGIEVMNFRICEEEERVAHVGDEGTSIYVVAPSTKFQLN